MKEQAENNKSSYDLFISYSNTPDYQLSRKIEATLESFHKLKTSDDIKLKTLSVCRDGSDFSLHAIKRQAKEKSESDDFVKDVLVEYLQQSQYLLVLCSKNAVLSEYVQFEIKWFLENRGPDFILLGVTEGADLKIEVKEIFSQKLLEEKLHTKIFYDLRGFKKESRQWAKVRDAEEELTNIAAFLNHETSGKILPLWRRQEIKKIKTQRYIGLGVALVFLAISIIAIFQWGEAIKQKEIVQEELVTNYWMNSKKEIKEGNTLNGLYFMGKAIASTQKENLKKELLTESQILSPLYNLSLTTTATDNKGIIEELLPKSYGYTTHHTYTGDSTKYIKWNGNEITIFEIRTNQLIGKSIFKSGAILSAILNEQKNMIIACGEDGLYAWNLNNRDSQEKLVAKKNGVLEAIFSKDGSKVLIRCYNEISIYSCLKGTNIGHPLFFSDAVVGAAFSRDDNKILTWTEKNSVECWDIETGARLGKILNHNEPIVGGAFFKNTDLILTWSKNGNLKTWDLTTGELSKKLIETNGNNWDMSITGAVFNKDMSRFFTWGNDGMIRIWNSGSGELVGTPLIHRATFLDLIISKDEKEIVSWGPDDIKVWKINDDRISRSPIKYDNSVKDIVFNKNKSLMVSLESNGATRLWNATTGSPIGPIFRHAGTYPKAIFSFQEDKFFSWDSHNKGYVFNSNTGEPEGKIIEHTEPIIGAQFSNDGKKFITWGDDETVRIWDAITGELIGNQMFSIGHLYQACFSSDNNNIISLNYNGVTIWDAQTGEEVKKVIENFENISQSKLIKDGAQLLFFKDSTIVFQNIFTGELLAKPIKVGHDIYGLRYYEPADFIIVNGGNNTIQFYDFKSRKAIGKTIKHDGSIDEIVFSAEGNRFATRLSKDSLQIWKIEGQNIEEHQIIKSEISINDIEFTRDGKRMLSWSDKGEVLLWDTETGEMISAVMRHEKSIFNKNSLNPVAGATFDKDESKIISWGFDGIKEWDTNIDLDITGELFNKQLQVITGVNFDSFNNTTYELSIFDWKTIKDEYSILAREHYKTCKYPEYNFWARFNPEEAKKIRTAVDR